MSKNIIHTIGQHVFKYLPPEFTEQDAPFLAKNPKDLNIDKKYQFLGQGYYFWDYNIRRAHNWGRTHYRDEYMILELPLILQGDGFLDLVGSREDLETFIKIYQAIKNTIPDPKIGAFINGMQLMEKLKPGCWPFKVIRALNLKPNSERLPFNSIPNSEMMLDPEIIICFYDRNELNLQNLRFINKTY